MCHAVKRNFFVNVQNKITKINDVSVHVQNSFVYNRGIHDNDKLNYIYFLTKTLS